MRFDSSKFLLDFFSQLFGEIDAENEVSPDVSDRDAFDGQDEAMSNGNENGKTDGEGEDGAGVVSVREWATVNSYNPEVLFRKVRMFSTFQGFSVFCLARMAAV